MGKRQARAWPLRCRDWGRVLRRIDVSSRDGCVKDCLSCVGRTFARPEIRIARYTVAHAAPAAVWRHRDFADPLSASLAHCGRIAAQILTVILSGAQRSRL